MEGEDWFPGGTGEGRVFREQALNSTGHPGEAAGHARPQTHLGVEVSEAWRGRWEPSGRGLRMLGQGRLTLLI